MKKVIFKRFWNEYEPGETKECSDQQAEVLERLHYVEVVEQPEAKPKPTPKSPKKQYNKKIVNNVEENK